jgi:hypothetical protein
MSIAHLKLTSELFDDLREDWNISSDENWMGVHRSTGKKFEAKSLSSLVKMLHSWTRDLYMAVC